MEKYKGIISIVSVIIMLVCGFLGIKSIFYSTANTEVPDVVGMKSQEAVTAMKDAGFIPFIDRVTASAPSDTVVSQSFEAGSKQTKGSTVYLRVSFGGSTLEIPDLTGKKLDDAVKMLQDMGLTVDEIRKMPNSEYPAGVVFAQNPSSPQTVDTSTKITLLVSSSGDESSLIQIPDVIGKTQAEAKSVIEKSGLKLGEVKLQRSSSVANGCVVSQTPDSGLNVSAGTVVSIAIASANAVDDLAIERGIPEEKTAPIKRVVVENTEELAREAANEARAKNRSTKQATKVVREPTPPKEEKKQEKQKNRSTQKSSDEVKTNTAKGVKQSSTTQQVKKEIVSVAPKIKQTEQKQSQDTPQDKQTTAKTVQTGESKTATEQTVYTGKVAKIRYQTPPITGHNMSLKIVIHDDDGTRVLRDGAARSLEYISMNAKYKGTAKISIYLGGEEVWHDKYN